ncbi:hypothetical protein [Streptomyces sp. V3I7]|uniref:hypothetical protein n=1 Tax=Streptomyces sp. V3I7 TaxID=3042278 RepID=UPI002785C496|nr:hypothetical protein [Streptomyces sp. V3I7]MDQ0992191.1 hypothetical protein [Streptomyces sp. V3I7]
MTDHEIQLIVLGVAAGMNLMLLLQIVFEILDDRRARTIRRTHEAMLAAAREKARA